MSLIWVDGFDHYASSGEQLAMYSGRTNGPSIGAGGRNGSRLLAQSNDNSLRKSALPAHATYIVGCAVKLGSVGGSGNFNAFVTINDTGTRHVGLGILNGVLRVFRADGTVLGTSGLNQLSVGNWYFIEFKVFISATVGTIDVKVNGVSWISATGLNTHMGSTTTANEFDIGAIATNGVQYEIDDLYVCTGAGSTNNDFLGDCKVETLYPNGDGNSSVLVGSDGNSVNNSLLVDEATPNGDTDYVESGTPGDKDTYAYGNLATTAGTVFGVMPALYARKTDAGSRSVVSVNRLAGTEVDSAVQTLLDNYTYLLDIRETKPGGGAYAIADVNSSEFGVKVNA